MKENEKEILQRRHSEWRGIPPLDLWYCLACEGATTEPTPVCPQCRAIMDRYIDITHQDGGHRKGPAGEYKMVNSAE